MIISTFGSRRFDLIVTSIMSLNHFILIIWEFLIILLILAFWTKHPFEHPRNSLKERRCLFLPLILLLYLFILFNQSRLLFLITLSIEALQRISALLTISSTYIRKPMVLISLFDSPALLTHPVFKSLSCLLFIEYLVFHLFIFKSDIFSIFKWF